MVRSYFFKLLLGGFLSAFLFPLKTLALKHIAPLPSVQIDSLLKEAEKFKRTNPTKSHAIAKEAYTLAKSQKNAKRMADIQLVISNYFINKARYDSALSLVREAQKTFETRKDSSGMAKAYMQIGVIGFYQSNADVAIANLLQAASFLEALKDSSMLAGVYNNLGSFHQRFYNDYSKAITFFQKSYVLKSELGDKAGANRTLGNIGNALTGLGNIDSGIFILKKTIAYKKEVGDSVGIAITLSNIGSGYIEAKEYEKAAQHLRQAVEIDRSLKDTTGLYHDLAWLAESYLESGKLGVAHKSASEGLSMAEDWVVKEKLLNTLSQLAEKRDDFPKALYYNKEAASLRDSIYKTEKQKEISKLEVAFETKQKEQEIQLLEKEKSLSEVQLQQAKAQRQLLLAVAGGLILVIGLVVVQLRQRNRHAQVMESKNQQLSELMAAKEKVFSIIAHDLKSPLSAFRNLSVTLSQNIEAFSKEEIKGFLENLVKGTDDLNQLLNNLLQWSLSETGMLQVKPEVFNMGQLAENAVKPLKDFARLKGIELYLSVSNDRAEADRQMIETVIRNLVANAIKFTPEGGEVKLQSDKSDQQFQLTVSDTGVGISQEDQKKLFKIQENVAQIGGHEGKGTGLGLILCKELVEKNHGTIAVKSIEGKGATFTISLPLSA